MDKVTLTKEQLKELKRFINSRGFREPLIVMEILDHFACLVEEKLQANPGMSLDDAMLQAHGSFGVMGFRTIADAADMERNKRLNRQFKSILRGMLLSPSIWLLLVLVGAVYYQLYTLVVYTNVDDTGLITYWSAALIFIIGKIVILKKFRGMNDRYVSGKGTVADNWYIWTASVLFTFLVTCFGPEWPLWVYAISATLYFLAVLVFMITMYRTWQEIEKYYSDIEQLHAELDTQ